MKYDYEDLMEITSLRHKMHVCNDVTEWIGLLESAHENLKELKIKDSGIARYDIGDLPQCEKDDCGYEGGESCDYCDEMEEAFLDEKKEEVNTQIESFLEKCEEKHGIENLAPTGIARYNWIKSV